MSGVDHSYVLRPTASQKFRPVVVQDVIHRVLQSLLAGKTYDSHEFTQLTSEISVMIKEQLKELNWDRYKFVVQVVIGEQRGEGVKVASRCFWDADTDNFSQDVFLSDTLFCVAAAYGIYFY